MIFGVILSRTHLQSEMGSGKWNLKYQCLSKHSSSNWFSNNLVSFWLCLFIIFQLSIERCSRIFGTLLVVRKFYFSISKSFLMRKFQYKVFRYKWQLHLSLLPKTQPYAYVFQPLCYMFRMTYTPVLPVPFPPSLASLFFGSLG